MNTASSAGMSAGRQYRLEWEHFRGEHVAALTVRIDGRKPLFTDANIFSIFEKILLSECRWYDCEALVYLFMPDHCHTVLQGKSITAESLRALAGFTQKSGYWLLQHRLQFRWQEDFGDRILQGKKDIEGQIRYILNNPVRKGLVADWHSYRYKGSTKYNFDEWK
jgi:REP element-mobilizing transposase RayT